AGGAWQIDDSEARGALRCPELVQRCSAAAPLEHSIHAARQKRRHLRARHVARRIERRRRRSSRDPQREDFQYERTERIGGGIGEGTAGPEEALRDSCPDSSQREEQGEWAREVC